MNENEKLASLTRKELVDGALELGIPRPELLTRAELVLEITRVGEGGKVRRPAGFLDVARALLASVVEQGLNLPDAANFIRGAAPPSMPPAPAPIATVTLAQIYGAQGHLDRALSTVDEILRAEPDHEAAQRLAAKLRAQIDEQKGAGRPPRPTPSRKRAAIGGAVVAAPAEATTPAEPTTPAPPVAPPPAYEAPLVIERTTAAEAPIISEVPVEPSPESGGVPASGTDPGMHKAAADFVAVVWSVDVSGKRGACRVAWELSDESRSAAAKRWGAGAPSLKVLTVTPTRAAAIPRESLVSLSGSGGTLPLGEVSERAEVRAALGWVAAGTFHVLGTGFVIERGPAGARTVWKPRAGAPEAALHAWLESGP